MTSPTRPTPPPVYKGEQLRAIAMPLGGIGTGSVALCGDGSLRQWQLCNNVNHVAQVPHSFFAIRAQKEGGKAVSKALQSPALYDTEIPPVASSTDYLLPAAHQSLLRTVPGVKETEFIGEYPLAEVRYIDEELPVEVSLTAYSPFCPLDAEASGLPAVVFQFRVKNPSERPVNVQVAATLQNFVGWDGISPIADVDCAQYGGNQNHALRLRGLTAVVMENTQLPVNHPQNGSLCLTALQEGSLTTIGWDDLSTFWNAFQQGTVDRIARPISPTPDGKTLNGAVTASLRLEPSGENLVTFVLAWYFPNRYITWEQGYSGVDDPKSLFWQGNAYSKRFASATGVAEYVRDNFTQLDSVTRCFRDTFFNSTLPYPLLDTVSSQASIIRTPTCLWTEDGRFHAFEGCHGASTWQSAGGCCPMNCTHVYAYEMTLSALFPDLERSMRETELYHQLHATGYLPHRVVLPMYLPRAWERPIGGPEKPALDGLLSMVLKVYREHKRNPDAKWLERAWKRVKLAMEHVMSVHDSEGDGVIRGEQPNTYDISVFGPNTFMGTLYLAALRSAEEMAQLQGESDIAEQYRARFEQGSKNYDELLWKGEYWIQIYDPEKNPEQNYGQGCHSDHLFGQWWAHTLGLGYVLPKEHVRAALRSILKYNFRGNFVGHKQIPRVFVSDDEPGVVICSWPHGGRPEVPTLYSDEIWTGIEYEVAALCIFEGMIEEAVAILRAVRSRYDGARRSPWNDVECGDHYARAMSSWALMEAACGYRYDASTASLSIAPRIAGESFRAFFITATAWGSVSIECEERAVTVLLEAQWGNLELKSLTLSPTEMTQLVVWQDGAEIPYRLETTSEAMIIHFTYSAQVSVGGNLEVRLLL
ncbi:hypothetical protein LBMAG21_05820 [Armatimonadota bacterium]|nr:hypothetical protein LBMAG21_05820 [Armatimonadota bacterium]